MNLKAKPIIKNQYWVVTNGKTKVGNVIAEGSGFEVRLGNEVEHYTTTKAIEKTKQIQFEKVTKLETTPEVPSFAVYPTKGNRIFNSILDIRRKLHLFTTSAKSKCYYVAGWFALKQNEEYVAIFCPKYIFVQRYDYKGPFKTESEANSSINTV
jgi:hypothetical protein